MTLRYIRHLLNQWALYRAHRETRRAIPELAIIDRRRAECRRKRKRGIPALDREAMQIMTAALAGKRRAG